MSKISLGTASKVPWSALLSATMIASLPMLVVHELGHFVAGNLAGLRMLEFSLGAGPVVWQRSIGTFKMVVRRNLLTGHVRMLRQKDTSPVAMFVFIAGGPAANLGLAAAVYWWAKVDLWAFFSAPTIPALIVAANLWIALLTLTPFASKSAGVAATGSDGWQLLRLLRGKNPTYDEAELASLAKSKVGKDWIEAAAVRSRRASLGFLYFLMLLLVIVWMLIEAKFPQSDGPHPHRVLLGSFLVGLGVLRWRIAKRPLISFVTLREKVAASPYARQMLAYRHAFQGQAEAWNLFELPQETIQQLTQSKASPEKLQWLEEVIREYPQVRLLHLFHFDGLMAEQRYTDAAQVMEAVLGWEDLPPRLREHLETVHLAACLVASPDDETAARCHAAVAAAANEGLAMQLLLSFASNLVAARIETRLPLAETWARQAQTIFPYDPAAQTVLASTLIEQGKADEALSWLKAAQAVTAGTNQSIEVTAWMALAAAVKGQPEAASMLRQSLKQELPSSLKRRLEEALAALNLPTHKALQSAERGEG